MDVLENAAVAGAPFPHMMASGVLPSDRQSALARDYPDIRMPGFFPVDDFAYGESFAELIEDMRGRTFSELVSDRFHRPLVDAPILITIRRLSAKKDGRIHTDGPDKVVSALIYLNPSWDHDGGRLRLLTGANFDAPDSPEIDPVYGNFVAFERSDRSYHGHLPFRGERRVVQVAWLTGADALAHKQKRHGRTILIKSLLHLFGI
jgi:hypothetical protein